jgi:hypothetical protein
MNDLSPPTLSTDPRVARVLDELEPLLESYVSVSGFRLGHLAEVIVSAFDALSAMSSRVPFSSLSHSYDCHLVDMGISEGASCSCHPRCETCGGRGEVPAVGSSAPLFARCPDCEGSGLAGVVRG